jgi:hypothetical protein
MRRDVVVLERAVARHGQHLVLPDDDRADWNLAALACRLRLAERERHDAVPIAGSAAHLAAPSHLCYITFRRRRSALEKMLKLQTDRARD